MKDQISAAVICFNEEGNISRCLKSLSFCDEIIVVDSGSTDNTVSLAQQLGATVINNPWPGFVKQKQFALEQCSKKWVISLDADEEVSPELRSEIEQVLKDSYKNQVKFSGFTLLRVVYHLGIWWNKGGWHPEYRLRLFLKDKAKWVGRDPHDKAEVSGKIGKLKGALNHYSYLNFADQIERLNRYSTVMANDMVMNGKKPSILKLLLNPIARFFKFYILKKGFLHGLAGFMVAVIESFYVFLKYAKVWEAKRNRDSSL